MLTRWLRHSVLAIMGGLLLFALTSAPLSVEAVQPTATPGFEQICQGVLARAVKLTEQGCSATGRNEACYGYTVVHSQLQPGVDEATHRFAVGGDILPVRMLASLRTEPLNLADGTWGMAVLKMQANLPDTNPGQNVTFILFGDSTLQPDISRTNAFYLSTHLGGLTCKQIPQDSLLVRAPTNTRVSFTINGVNITASSIVVLRAAPGNVMLTRVLEGHIDLTSNGTTKNLVAGQELTVPIGGPNGLTAVGAPSNPVPAPLDTSLDSPAILLNTFDPSADRYQGPITLEGPIEAVNPLMPALTIYGHLVLVDQVGGWKGLQVGDWVHIEGDVQGIMIVARHLRPDRSSMFVEARPTAIPTAVPPTASSPVTSQSGNSSGGGNGSTGDNSSNTTPVVPTALPTATLPDRLRLTSECSPDPAVKRLWRVQNPRAEAVAFTWDMPGSQQHGAGVVPGHGETGLETQTESGPNTVRLFVNGVQQDMKDSNPAPCADSTPSPTDSATSSATAPATDTATSPATSTATDVATSTATSPATSTATTPATEQPTATATEKEPTRESTKHH